MGSTPRPARAPQARAAGLRLPGAGEPSPHRGRRPEPAPLGHSLPQRSQQPGPSSPHGPSGGGLLGTSRSSRALRTRRFNEKEGVWTLQAAGGTSRESRHFQA